jgi:hypothetical protein
MWKKLAGKSLGKPIICGETAFPDGGQILGEALPSKTNSVAYFNDLYAWSVENQTEVIFFEAADENWKGAPESVETHWGICDTFGAVKPCYWESLAAIIKWKTPEKLTQTPTATLPPEPSKPAATLAPQTVAPKTTPKPYSGEPKFADVSYYQYNAVGKVQGVDPKKYAVILFIKVGGSYYIKPTWDDALTPLDENGIFSARAYTNDENKWNDRTASAYSVFCVPADFNPRGMADFSDIKSVRKASILALEDLPTGN